ncbi:carbon-nitrogen hydrolase [soil metagenome]
MKAAVAQISSVLGNIEKNIEQHVKFCEEAISRKAELIIFPELSLTGYSLKDLNYDVAIDPYTSLLLDPLREISKKISIVCGLVEEDSTFAVYNSAAFISDGEVKCTHKKIYPPTYGIFEERRYFSAGKDVRAFDSKFGRLGLMVCEDLWHLSVPYMLAVDKAQILIGIAASPTRISPGSENFRNYEINSEHHKTYSRILSTYLLFSNRVGFEDGVNFWGGSEITDPSGTVIAKAKLFEEDIIYADIYLDEVRRTRHLARHFLDEDPDQTIKNLRNIIK